MVLPDENVGATYISMDDRWIVSMQVFDAFYNFEKLSKVRSGRLMNCAAHHFQPIKSGMAFQKVVNISIIDPG